MLIIYNVLNILISLIVVIFTFNCNSLFRSVLILINSFIVSLRVYAETGFSWYFLLFVLVYVGGIYIILIYISMVLPNFSLFNVSFISYFFVFGFLFVIWFYLSHSSILSYNWKIECSFYLCNNIEILVYIFLCIILMISLAFVNFIVSAMVDNSHFR
uniref:NADH dehydrogenase subunit 6 n=1 Tax=Schistosoma kisumuensis TaxID=646316 RepID=C5IDT8_9TREM|nr:NADH dehydrogenase subunit 6 [Schistosoma kisumuensis]ACR50711.1 NADH dehydrogenase subunit 6 [Schistosoma kisumuensis]ACR50712.1 NADH dehydrogenase subunit 6 [Schistosoma kisumuensis]